MDPRTPVVIGAGQLSNRVDRGAEPLEPVDLMVEAARRAVTDSGGTGVVDAIDSVRTVALLSWRYRNPGHHVAERLGARGEVDSAISAMGGNSPQMLLNVSCADIAAGRNDLVLLAGAEAWRTRTRYRSAGDKPPWTREPDELPEARSVGEAVTMNCDAETSLGIFLPVQVYPLFEQAHRHALGRGLDEHRRAIGELWSGFSRVASSNPHAWIQEPMAADEIITPTPDNRIIGYPYTKVMNANNSVEQGAAVLLCSVERAEALGVPRDRWVFPLAGADAREHPFVSNRADLRSSPAMGVAGRAMLDVAGIGIDDVDHVDLYSCFPIAVELGAQELGLGLDRQLTVTGGLAFAGGPWNDYVMHSIATMVGTLRADPGSTGLVWANGGYFTKHAFGLYSTRPPADGWRHVHPQDEIDALPRRDVATDVEGHATVESWTVMHDKDGAPENGIFALLLADGRRAWGTTQDPAVVPHLLDEDLIGHRVHRAADGQVSMA